MNRIALLRNPIKEYAWGSRSFLQGLMKAPSPADRPWAELWMGTHPNGSSMVSVSGDWIPLPEWLEKDPEGILGRPVAERFANELPFLFKILAAARPLSIQVHPNREQAHQGFARENRLGTPLDAPHRNYRDEHHKPEILCALTPFWALKGFRKIEEIMTMVDKIGIASLEPEWATLRRQPDTEGMKLFFGALMRMEREKQQSVVREAVAAAGKDLSSDPEYVWMRRLNEEFPGEIGVLSPLFLNLLHLSPGEAIHIRPGELHTYLEGSAIELMANSDNVLRAGLTRKHTDITELLSILDLAGKEVPFLKPRSLKSGEIMYPVPCEEFLLSMIPLRRGATYESAHLRNVEIMICVEGDAAVTDPGTPDRLDLPQGASAIVPASVRQYRIEGEARIYKATVPRSSFRSLSARFPCAL